MASEVYREINRCYEFIANMLNKHYRDELLNIDEVERGKFIVKHDPEGGGPKILFVWSNDFGLERLEGMEDMDKEIDRVIREVVRPAEKKVTRRVMEIENEFGDDFYPRINSFHHLHVQNYALAIARDEAN